MMGWLYHGRNRCYYEARCLLCFVKVFFAILRLRRDK